MKTNSRHPSANKSFSVSTYAFVSTSASGTMTTSGVDVSALTRGQSIFLDITSGSSEGFTDLGEYFVIPVGTNSFRIAASREDAINGNPILTASGNAGAGTVYPNYSVNGNLFVGTSGDVNCRGTSIPSGGGTSSFSLLKKVPDGTLLDLNIKDVSALNTTASDFVSWTD
jgi:hypothetical protein